MPVVFLWRVTDLCFLTMEARPTLLGKEALREKISIGTMKRNLLLLEVH